MGNGETNEENRPNEPNRIYYRNYRINELEARTNRISEKYKSHGPIIFDDIDESRKSICKIKTIYKSEKEFGTGFFLDYNSFKYLITNFHVITKIIKNIEIEIWDKTIIKMNLNNRDIIYLPNPKDITIIKIKQNEINNIQYLSIDLNYSKGYQFYKDKEVFTAGYPKGEKLAAGNGKIKGILNEYEFYHNIPTERGSSGSPIILFNTLTVIGIHKEAAMNMDLNIGIFIGEAIKEINANKIKINDIKII